MYFGDMSGHEIKVYRLAKGWAIFIYVIAPLWIASFGYLLIAPLLPDWDNDAAMRRIYPFMAPISAGMIGLMIAGVVEAVKGKFIIAEHYVQSVSVIGTRTLLLEDIRGYRTVDHYLFLESVDRTKKRIRVSVYSGGFADISDWLKRHFPDLDQFEALEDKFAVMGNEAFGLTEEDRKEKLVQARKVAKIMNWLGGAVGLWLLLLPTPYTIAIYSGVLYPILSIGVLWYFKGLIGVEDKKQGTHPSILLGLSICLLVVPLRAMMDYQILDYQQAWVLSACCTALSIILFFGITRGIRFQGATPFFPAFWYCYWCLAIGLAH